MKRRAVYETKTLTFSKDSTVQQIPGLAPEEHYDQNVRTIETKIIPWMANLRQNFPLILECDNNLPPNSRPGIAVGGSNPKTPLLAQNGGVLPRFRGRVFACDRAVPQIADWRIPDVAVYIESNRDPHHEWLVHKRYVDAGMELWAMPFVHPDVVRDYRKLGGTVRFFHVQYPVEVVNLPEIMFALLPEGMSIFWTGGNVGLTTWFAAVGTGCRPVALVGYDFGIDADGKVETTTTMAEWARSLIDATRTLAVKGALSYDCTEGGLLSMSDDIPHLTLKEFVGRFQDG